MYRSFILLLACVILAACGGEPTRYKRPADMTMEQAQRHLDECQEQASHVWASQSSLERCMASRGLVKQ
jgi:outer membrane biogenesis lipoprotein LolB